MTAEIDRAIRKTNLGLNPVSDGKTLKIQTFRILPSLTDHLPDGTVDLVWRAPQAMTMREDRVGHLAHQSQSDHSGDLLKLPGWPD